MSFVYALCAVIVLALMPVIGVSYLALGPVFGILLPYAAFAAFVAGLARRVIVWANSPVPFRIPTTCGQQKSVPGIRPGRLETPATAAGAAARMALEVLLFRSLFRNSKAELLREPRLIFSEAKFLWLGALTFHWSLLCVILRHSRFFLEPVPRFVKGLQALDGFFQIGAPVLYVSDGLLVGALVYLLLRRICVPILRYLSLFSDFFAVCLLLAAAASGIWMRYFAKVDILAVKKFTMGLVLLSPGVPEGLPPAFFLHLFLASVLLAYVPFSKLVHGAGAFLSPTRNLAGNNRMKRHVNPWDRPVKVHSYGEWESEYRDKIRAAGLPLEGEQP